MALSPNDSGLNLMDFSYKAQRNLRYFVPFLKDNASALERAKFYLTSLRFDLKHATHSKSRKTKILIPPKLASFVKSSCPNQNPYLPKPR